MIFFLKNEPTFLLCWFCFVWFVVRCVFLLERSKKEIQNSRKHQKQKQKQLKTLMSGNPPFQSPALPSFSLSSSSNASLLDDENLPSLLQKLQDAAEGKLDAESVADPASKQIVSILNTVQFRGLLVVERGR